MSLCSPDIMKMNMTPTNLVFIFSDQHNHKILGCSGNAHVQTPNLDELAKHGTIFTNAYTNSPLCCPARASLATGRYVHHIHAWNNVFAYNGSEPGWGHRLKEHGYQVDAIGKLHFRSEKDDNGFSHEYNTLHVVNGVGDVAGCLRYDPTIFNKRKGVLNAGIGTSSYIRYDAENADRTCRWLDEHRDDEKPWMLFLGLALPHPPNLVPEEFFHLYQGQDLPMPPQWDQEHWPTHPAIAYARRFYNFEEPIAEEKIRNFLVAYYAAVSYIDAQIAKVFHSLEENGLIENTRIIYSSDHGEDLGARGIFGKFNMYDEATKIPLFMTGPDIPQGLAVETPVSLVDIYPTILEAFNIPLTPEEETFPGKSLWSIMQHPKQDRTIFGEYHGGGTRNGIFMLKNTCYKYVYYVDAQPQLFDSIEDPDEINDLSQSPSHQHILREFEHQLRKIVDPEAIDALAKSEQRKKIDEAGGEEAIRARGTFDNSPIPGEKPLYFKR